MAFAPCTTALATLERTRSAGRGSSHERSTCAKGRGGPGVGRVETLACQLSGRTSNQGLGVGREETLACQLSGRTGNQGLGVGRVETLACQLSGRTGNQGLSSPSRCARVRACAAQRTRPDRRVSRKQSLASRSCTSTRHAASHTAHAESTLPARQGSVSAHSPTRGNPRGTRTSQQRTPHAPSSGAGTSRSHSAHPESPPAGAFTNRWCGQYRLSHRRAPALARREP